MYSSTGNVGSIDWESDRSATVCRAEVADGALHDNDQALCCSNRHSPVLVIWTRFDLSGLENLLWLFLQDYFLWFLIG